MVFLPFPRFVLKPICSVWKKKSASGAKESDFHSTPRLSTTAGSARAEGLAGPRSFPGHEPSAVRTAPGSADPHVRQVERRAAGTHRPQGCSSPPPRELYPSPKAVPTHGPTGPPAAPLRPAAGGRVDPRSAPGPAAAVPPPRPRAAPGLRRPPPPPRTARRPSVRPRRARTHRARGAGRRGARGARPQWPGAGCRLSLAAARRCPDPRAPPAADACPGAGRRRGASARRPPPPRCAPPAGCGGRRGGLHQPRLYSGPGLRGGVGNAEPAGLPAPHVREGGRGSGAAGRGAARRGGTSRRPRHPRHPRPRRTAAPRPALCPGPARAALRGAGRPAPQPGCRGAGKKLTDLRAPITGTSRGSLALHADIRWGRGSSHGTGAFPITNLHGCQSLPSSFSHRWSSLTWHLPGCWGSTAHTGPCGPAVGTASTRIGVPRAAPSSCSRLISHHSHQIPQSSFLGTITLPITDSSPSSAHPSPSICIPGTANWAVHLGLSWG